ncbi:MAG TPA: 2-succinyl-5-enolpyruvyl-6-hydroxy-3-cyclohexene-1-carboxylate synthase [Candidatus Fimimorpha faecalis]|uniref:2-succinyl-5-enolpyruvyl-6-hydroxy-3-cyclohexene-1-carboxylate synthase n=1 Tax=Candidatus Fimimorpha faecalis TaxID=2840824 RepID=A0A9D1EBT8_9FIRM|nr:2-succinyl-5-enolpyruvyl-6-hydroxy-3-cyclohexene-1-carboxylate synthase [Candidatus Fimimorpha faecalis]
MNYTNERNVQMLVYLLKAHGIKKVVASPGTTNVTFVASLQNDPYFEIYSCVDERSAAYIACGMAAESDEPVVLSCTGATASRNYVPGLTEAFYRKLPILAVTSSRENYKIGHLQDQVTDRTCPMRDIAKISVQIPSIHNKEEEWAYGVEINKAILELHHRGAGPVHINIVTTYNWTFTTKEISPVRVIKRLTYKDSFPQLKDKRIAIYIGSHKNWRKDELDKIDIFCEKYNAIVLYDVTSNYRGKYGIPLGLAQYYTDIQKSIDVLIHLGEVAGFQANMNMKEVWRVNPDGEIRDLYCKLKYVFEIEEMYFFDYYNKAISDINNTSFFAEWKEQRNHILAKMPELPFSNTWIGFNSLNFLPKSSILHLGILNSLRSWSLLDLPQSVRTYSNTGGYGIDGGISTLIGASLIDRKKLYFGIFGDLAFFYDLNSIGNHNVGNNVRIMLINNGRGVEFRLPSNPGSQFGDDTDKYIAAAGHYGNKSIDLVKHYSQDLGFNYLTASDKDEFNKAATIFFSENRFDKPIIFEVFVDYKNDVKAYELINSIVLSANDKAKQIAKSVLGTKTINQIKKTLRKG